MCLKNINTDIIFFQKNGNVNTNSLQFPVINAKYTNDEKTILTLDNVNFIFSVNAVEKLLANSPIHEEGENPDNTFFFSEKYQIRFRITESVSGRFYDLMDFIFIDTEKEIANVTRLCRNIYTAKKYFNYDNILVSTPPDNKNLCVFKVLIRRYKPEVSDFDNPWIVQSMHPIKLNIIEKE